MPLHAAAAAADATQRFYVPSRVRHRAIPTRPLPARTLALVTIAEYSIADLVYEMEMYARNVWKRLRQWWVWSVGLVARLVGWFGRSGERIHRERERERPNNDV